jgi:hypothetical protein
MWTGRASQEVFGDGEVGLALMYAAYLGAVVLGHHGYPRASVLISG